MKKRIYAIGMIIAAVTLLIWCVPMLIGRAQSKPLEGSFLIANCACGHDIFYLIEGGMAYDYCPGHDEKKLIGSVAEANNQIKVLRSKDGVPDVELKLQDGTYYLRYPTLKDDDWDPVEQITDPWRTSWRSYFPE